MDTSPVPVCAKCGQQHLTSKGKPSCAGHSRQRDGAPCRQPPVASGVCHYHGGRSPHVQAAAKRRRQAAALAATVAEIAEQFDIQDTDPTSALHEALDTTCRMVATLEFLVGQLSPAAVTTEHPVEDKDGKVIGTAEQMERDGGLYMPTQSGMAPHPLTVMLADWTKQKAHVSKAALDAGISERQVRVAEATAGQFIAAIRTILDGLGLTAAQQQLVPQLVRTAMQAIPVETG